MKYELGFDEKTLREFVKDPAELRCHLQELEIELLQTSDIKRKVSILGEQGLRYRTLHDLDLAEAKLREALEMISAHCLGVQREIQQKLRLGHVLQWKKEFSASDAMFAECLETCLQHPEAAVYLDFTYQHAGKNFFDQERYQEAYEFFVKALEIRKQKNSPADQIESSELAIKVTAKLL